MLPPHIRPAYSSTFGFTLCAQLWSHGIKVKSNQIGCGVEQGLMGLYIQHCMQEYYLRPNRGSMDGGEAVMEREWDANGDRNYLADHVSSGSSPWQGKCSVDMAMFHCTHTGVVGQGTISSVSIVQEAVGIRALISQHWYMGEEWERSLGLFGTGTSEHTHKQTHASLQTQHLMHEQIR